jgi:Lipocalin-like domain
MVQSELLRRESEMKRVCMRHILFIIAILWSELVASAESSVVGTWRLQSYLRHDVATGENTKPWGERPTGYLTYLPDGHMLVVMTSEARQLVPSTDEKFVEKSSQLIFNMTAYAGKYEVRDSRVFHHVEVAWLPTWVGTDQPREYSFEGDSLSIRTQAIKNARDGREYVYVLVWTRVTP